MHIMLATHGTFCQGILDSYHMIAGANEKLHAISLTEEGIAPFTKKFLAAMEKLSDKEVLVITDIKGGTPYNEAFNYYLSHTEKVRVAAGLNLPMLIETGLAMEGATLNELYEMALTAGRTGVAGIDEEEFEDDVDF